MKKIAITGSYASGKSYVLSILAGMGYQIFSSDEYVRNLYKNENFQKNLWKYLGEVGEFDKEIIKVKILHNDDFRKKLEDFIHPMVKMAIEEFIDKHHKENSLNAGPNVKLSSAKEVQISCASENRALHKLRNDLNTKSDNRIDIGSKSVVGCSMIRNRGGARHLDDLVGDLLFCEVPLLFEADMQEYFEKSISVYCSEETRKARAMEKIGFSEDKFEAINNIQMTQSKKMELADYVLNSDQGMQEIIEDLNTLIHMINSDKHL